PKHKKIKGSRKMFESFTQAASAAAETATLSMDNLVVFISMLLLSFVLPLAILFAKVFFKDRRIYAGKLLAAEFEELAKTYTFRFALAKYVDTGRTSIRDSLASYDRSNIFRTCRSELPAYLLPVLAYAVICAAGFYTAIMVKIVDVDKPDHFDNYLIY